MTPLTKLVSGVQVPLYVLRRISDGSVTNPRATSNTTGAPNPGPDQEYLPIMVDVLPDNDPRYTVRTQVEGPNEASVPKQWEIKYVVSDRPLEEKLAAVINAKRFEASRQVPSQDAIENLTLSLAAVLVTTRGLQPTPAQQASIDAVLKQAAALTENLAIAEDAKAAVVRGELPALETWAAKAV